MHKTTNPCGHPPPPHPTSPLKYDVVSFPTLQPYNHHNRHDRRHRCSWTAAISQRFMVTAAVSAAASSWLHNRRIRYLFLLLCSPLLLVLLCAVLPFLCAAELCLRRRLWRKLIRDEEEGRCGCGCEEEEEEEKGLLHRYLEDQLLLVRSMYDCGDIGEVEEEEGEEDPRRVVDVENLSSCRIPLLR
ncbi:hypothetical protein HN51_045034 [Arachis hypogaea]|uniref:Transmembrane protein n=2 Tax=Arachis hypogaea TaxID=3818 RepID=A0A444Y1E1_ARAHY|nr:uncharacterized protein LOC107612910 [Arachis ipaensis]XP_025673077.1 uncharacterized protein LOC112772358 [Arachis hypogaea]QHN97341.1 uncharacterized protein DS421_18g626520 [Arachis hypogaea]RYQ95732.1 hypothetical protein Ahy_B08g091076 isoform B [Arachis hypogaea]